MSLSDKAAEQAEQFTRRLATGRAPLVVWIVVALLVVMLVWALVAGLVEAVV